MFILVNRNEEKCLRFSENRVMVKLTKISSVYKNSRWSQVFCWADCLKQKTWRTSFSLSWIELLKHPTVFKLQLCICPCWRKRCWKVKFSAFFHMFLLMVYIYHYVCVCGCWVAHFYNRKKLDSVHPSYLSGEQIINSFSWSPNRFCIISSR